MERRIVWGIVVLALLGAAGYTAFAFLRWRQQHASRSTPGPAAGEGMTVLDSPRRVPDFTLTDASGAEVSREDLLGRVWVADFIFTSCRSSCPAMTARMAAIQDAVASDPVLHDRVRLVSFSVDPERDTPEVLAEYAERHGAERGLWTFLTGPPGAVAELSRTGFLLSAGENPDAATEAGAPPVLHSDRFALVDARGRIRTYVARRNDPDHVRRIVERVRSLVEESGSAPGPAEVTAPAAAGGGPGP